VARIIGDIPARQFGNLMRATLRWQSQSAAILGQDIAEYLQEESHELVTRVEVESFLRDVDTLRADAERLEQRVMRLREISDDTV
jgi:ubiquinone biosynthesis protein UbiJ